MGQCTRMDHSIIKTDQNEPIVHVPSALDSEVFFFFPATIQRMERLSLVCYILQQKKSRTKKKKNRETRTEWLLATPSSFPLSEDHTLSNPVTSTDRTSTGPYFSPPTCTRTRTEWRARTIGSGTGTKPDSIQILLHPHSLSVHRPYKIEGD